VRSARPRACSTAHLHPILAPQRRCIRSRPCTQGSQRHSTLRTGAHALGPPVKDDRRIGCPSPRLCIGNGLPQCVLVQVIAATGTVVIRVHPTNDQALGEPQDGREEDLQGDETWHAVSAANASTFERTPKSTNRPAIPPAWHSRNSEERT